MIGKLKGNIENIFEDHCLIDVKGVCYMVYCTTSILHQLVIGSNTSLFIHTMIKDDLQLLYGFAHCYEKTLFMFLTLVQGVGGKMALALIDELGCIGIIEAIQQENRQILQRVSGIGNKIAVRIINELRNNKAFLHYHMSNIALLRESDTHANSATSISTIGTFGIQYDNTINDATSALMNLGFKKSDITQIINDITQSQCVDKSCDKKILTLEELIRISMTKLFKR